MTVLSFPSPLSGQDVAVSAWALSREDLERVLPPSPPESVLDEVRAQFAVWAAAQPLSLFADLEAAWNAFIAPRHGLTRDAVLLPRAACAICAERKRLNDELHRVRYADCRHCGGVGHLPPRAIPAKPASTRTFGRRSDDCDVSVQSEPTTTIG